MTAAATAALLAATVPSPWLALFIIVAGGLVEGTALGVLQGVVLRRWLPGASAAAWAIVTVAIAGVGWAAASVPSQLAGGSGDGPPWWVILGGALLLGAIMGAVLGTGQSFVLRRKAPYPWRWVGISAAAWAPAMVIIFAGATAPDESWAPAAIIITASATGAAAGALLGLVSGLAAPLVAGESASGRATLTLLESRVHRMLGPTLIGLRVRGRRTGAVHELPVQYAPLDNEYVVWPSKHETKKWWRNLRDPAAVEVLRDGVWLAGVGQVVPGGSAGWERASGAYRSRFPKIEVPADAPLVVITPDGAGS
ncbi:nitroreductase/quinone reductase family protein [Antiquaquibacter oligotrophicus]|nr:nitroreductase/quinone reductase family protein [Antiquaquibacter oligotrophicus]UDF12255.1 nitroreductase/quinone reductase family protein [Antiquaquibacter oligotrophicus]